jgi:surface polysaccharide O-acyltransferase-like enzyme
MQTDRQTIEGLDMLRALAVVGVIVIHVATPVVKMAFGSDAGYWWTGNVADSCVRFAVPVFVMLSGATMLHRDYPLAGFYKKRMVRVLIPFLFWMVAYWIFRWLELPADKQPRCFVHIMQWAGQLFVAEGISKHFWYVYMIVFFYLFMPFLGRLVRRMGNRSVVAVLILWVVANIMLRNVPLNFYRWNEHWDTRLLAFLLFSGYLVLGYWLQKIGTGGRIVRVAAAGIWLVTVGVAAVSTWWMSRGLKDPDMSMYGNLTVNTMLQAASLFILLKDSSCPNRYVSAFRRIVSNYSYGIYLSHIMVLGILFDHGIFWTMAHPVVSLPLVTLLVLTISLAVVYLLRRLPFGKYFAG